jgi:hypothetical protein
LVREEWLIEVEAIAVVPDSQGVLTSHRVSH